MPDIDDRGAKDRLVRYLALIVDDAVPPTVRLAICGAVLDGLPQGHPLRHRTSCDLVESVLDPWQTKTAWNVGRRAWEERTVTRPPTTLSDVWFF